MSLENFQCNQLVLSRDTGDTDRLEELNFPNPKLNQTSIFQRKYISLCTLRTKRFSVATAYTAFETQIFSPD